MLTVAQAVCSKGVHTLSGGGLQVKALESSQNVPVMAVQVSRILDNWTRDLLSMFFENKKRSGGGPIEDVFINRSEHCAVITFENHDGTLQIIVITM